MKVMLLTPPLPPLFKRHVRERYKPFPLGIAYLGSVLRKSSYDVELIYSGALKLNSKKLLSSIEERKPDIVGFSVLSPHLDRAASFATLIKGKYPSISTVIGNVHATALPVETLRAYSDFDFLFSGESEDSFLKFIAAIHAQSHNFSSIKGLAYREENDVVFSGEPSGVKDLDALPFPAWDLFYTQDGYP